MAGSTAGDLLRSPIGLEFLAQVRESSGHLDALEVLGQIQTRYSRYLGDYDDHVQGLRSKAAELAKQADWIAREMASWWEPLDRTNQVWLTMSAEEPSAGAFVVDLRRFNVETPKPRRAVWTSTLFDRVSSMWLDHPEGPDEPFFWVLAVAPNARVAEISSPALWWSFATRYRDAEPGYVYNGRGKRTPEFARTDPDWSKVAEDWDGVHLAVGGYLTAEDVPFEQEGVTTELRGWNVESTVWLRWVCESSRRIG